MHNSTNTADYLYCVNTAALKLLFKLIDLLHKHFWQAFWQHIKALGALSMLKIPFEKLQLLAYPLAKKQNETKKSR